MSLCRECTIGRCTYNDKMYDVNIICVPLLSMGYPKCLCVCCHKCALSCQICCDPLLIPEYSLDDHDLMSVFYDDQYHDLMYHVM